MKVAYQLKASSTAQNFKVTLTNVTHNQPSDAAVFAPPPQRGVEADVQAGLVTRE